MCTRLPEDIVLSEILTRLPVKSLLRFRSVCKTWRSVVADPAFIKSHCTTRNPNDLEYVLSKSFHGGCAYGCGVNITLLSLRRLRETSLYAVGDLHDHKSLHLLGSINGIIGLFFVDLYRFALWNPAIRHAKFIDAPLRHYPLHAVYLSGFCWDAVEDDFKVVISYNRKSNYFSDGPLFSSYVYSCKDDSWSVIPVSPFAECNYSYSWERSVIVNGMPYWTCSRYCSEKGLYVSRLIKFEVGRNEFRMLTEFVHVVPDRNGFAIFNLKECVYALVYNSSLSKSLLDVYGLDDESGVWSKMYNVGPGHVDTLSQCLKYDGKIVFNARKKLMCYDGETNKIIKHLGNSKNLHNCFRHKASLVFIQGMEYNNGRIF